MNHPYWHSRLLQPINNFSCMLFGSFRSECVIWWSLQLVSSPLVFFQEAPNHCPWCSTNEPIWIHGQPPTSAAESKPIRDAAPAHVFENDLKWVRTNAIFATSAKHYENTMVLISAFDLYRYIQLYVDIWINGFVAFSRKCVYLSESSNLLIFFQMHLWDPTHMDDCPVPSNC